MSPQSPFRVRRHELAREALTISQALGFLLLSLAYLFPDELVRANSSGNMGGGLRVSVVSTFETFFGIPFFFVIFLIGGLCLSVVSVWWKVNKRNHPTPEQVLNNYKRHAWAHLVATSIAMTFALTITMSAFINPGTYIVSPLLALGMVATNAILMYAYAGK